MLKRSEEKEEEQQHAQVFSHYNNRVIDAVKKLNGAIFLDQTLDVHNMEYYCAAMQINKPPERIFRQIADPRIEPSYDP